MYFNGFALRDEEHFFDAILDRGAYTLSGFSYGAIEAFRAAQRSTKRVDRLQLISPAFFQAKSEKYKRLQLIGYKKESGAYLAKFTENCFSPYALQEHDAGELEDLLRYEWKMKELQALAESGTQIEVYLGGEDRITDVQAAYAFFLPFATVTLIKGANHFLQGEQDE